jgi:hypothetical protein
MKNDLEKKEKHVRFTNQAKSVLLQREFGRVALP